jgi:hypothetical protein
MREFDKFNTYTKFLNQIVKAQSALQAAYSDNIILTDPDHNQAVDAMDTILVRTANLITEECAKISKAREKAEYKFSIRKAVSEL